MLDRARQTLRVVAAGPRADARHAERTAEILRALGADEELVTAGLLHDNAKPAATRLWHRIAAVLLARPWVYGLGLAGEAGVEHVLRSFLADFDLQLGLSGHASVAELSPASLLRS